MSPLFKIRAAARMLGHHSCTDIDIKPGELEAIRGMIGNQIDDIECRWKAALDQELATRAGHEAALSAAKAEEAAPGQPGDHGSVRQSTVEAAQGRAKT